MSITSFLSKDTDCFFCHDKLKKKEAFTANVDTADGRLKIMMCESCGKDFDELMKSIEEVKNVGL